MAVTLGLLNNINLLPLSNWTSGTGGVTGFDPNQDAATENQRGSVTDPWGATSLVWGTYPSGNGNADGGWNSSYYAIDNTQIYRFSVWVRRTSATTGGTFYFGCHTNGTGDVYHLSDNSSNTNPYWDYRNIGWFNQNQWYLVVGHLYPNSYAGTVAHPDSGIYTIAAGKVTINAGNIPNDCKMGASATTAMHRTYHYYCGDTTSRLQFFSPRIEIVNSLTPPVQTLLTTNLVDSNTRPQGIIFSDNSTQTTQSTDSGKLISVATYSTAGSYTWSKPAGCTKVFVSVVGGGGGGAGHCESGGAGGYAEKMVDVSGVSAVTVTVGGAGAAVGYYAAAGNGGTSSFGSYCSATGGYGANQNSSHTGGHGGVGSSGDVNLLGGSGSGHSNNSSQQCLGIGGASYFGGSKKAGHNNSNPNNDGYNAPGCGGGGANQGYNYANGGAGMVIVYSYK